ncbi:BirA family transcriptional regulator, biotin operon repressor / biotin-[acetyl-CoA-carboxylase] ligase [Micrococcales bacterium KH10]|nr:BirA family transcriptional regulator, biotin operon repressor / biotin-[acetyl-CoA-carboxylase] ligase [Micrococcales bacterium KH10]
MVDMSQSHLVGDLDRDRLLALIAEQVGEHGVGYIPPVIEFWDELPSTNAYLADQWTRRSDELRDGTLVLTGHQSAGLGRRDRTWLTPPGSALTMSVLVDLDRIAPRHRTLLSALAGLAVAECVGDLTTAQVRLKWPNDVVAEVSDAADLDQWGRWRKLAGVLTVLVNDGERTAAVIGIGLNVRQRANELPVPHATSVALLTADETEALDRTELAANVMTRLLTRVTQLRSGRSEEILGSIAAASMMVGRRVRAALADGLVIEGEAIGLGESGQLVIRDLAGNHHALLEGDITQVRPAGSDA